MAAAEEKEAHTETLIRFFRYSPYFPPRRPPARGCCGRYFFLVALLFLRPLLLVFFFRSFARVSARIPSLETANSATALQPLEQQFIFIAVFRSRLFHPPFRARPNLARRAPALERCFFSSTLHALPQRSFDSSFFLSSLSSFHGRSRYPWSVISRRGGDENARLGLRALLSSFCCHHHLPRPSLHPTIPRSFPLFSRAAPLLLLAYARRCLAVGKSIDLERAARRGPGPALSLPRYITGVFAELMARSLSARRSRSTGDTRNARSAGVCAGTVNRS